MNSGAGAFDYDLFVIGGGSGGVRAARVAASEHGARVALAERDRYGGTCVIRGCVPKKLMVFASGQARALDDARAYGWRVPQAARGGSEFEPELGPEFDWPLFRNRLREELDRLEQVYRGLLANAGVTTHDQAARLVGPQEVELADGTRATARHVLVAVGGRPAVPDIPGAELGLVSDDMFDLPSLPKSLLVVGGGYIACEFACIMRGLGVDVTLCYRGPQILRGFDDECRSLICGEMGKSGIEILLDCNALELRKSGDRVSVTLDAARGASDGAGTDGSSSPRQREFDKVLFATGRSPNTGDLGLETTGAKLGRGGRIEVDEYSLAAAPSVHAIGDVTGRVALTPVAIHEAMAFVETVFGSGPTPVDHDLVPTAVFTRPEFGTVGLSEEDAASREAVDVYATEFKPMRTAFIGREERSLLKLVVSRGTGAVLGCHIVGPDAGEMIQLAGIAVKMGATKADFDRTMAVHPTAAEELVTMRVPARRVG